MEGIRPWQINERAVCEALIAQPDKEWGLGELLRVVPPTEGTQELFAELERLGAIEFYWVPRHPAKPVHPLDAGNLPSVRRLRLTADGAGIISNLLAVGRPRGVIGTFLWEGGLNAAAVWQAKRRERAWKRSRRSG